MQPKVNNVIDFEIFLFFFFSDECFSIVLNIIHVIFEKNISKIILLIPNKYYTYSLKVHDHDINKKLD